MKQKKRDNHTALSALKKMVEEFCVQRNWDKEHNPKDLAVGAVTEASELLEIFRFISEKQSFDMVQDSEIRQKIGEELADNFCFILRFAQLYDFDLTSCLENKLVKNAVKYPVQP